MKIETIAAHAGHSTDLSTGAVVPPIILSTTFEREKDGTYPHGYVYTRTENPNRDALEKCLCALEGGEVAIAFSSGSAATMSILQALPPQSHVIAPGDAYYGSIQLIRQVFAPWGLEASFVDMSDPVQVEQALQSNTRLIWVETPSNPLLKIADISRIAEIAHRTQALCVCDNTWATPVLQRPLELGADLVMHATTKYLNGHSDVLGGAVVARSDDDFSRRIRQIQRLGGAVAAPFDCWLALRGIRTLPYRVRAQSDSALQVATFLSRHSRVEVVHYPGLPQHPGYEIATRQMSRPGGMLSFQVNGTADEAFAVAAKVRVFTRATSLGGTESLIEHRASVEGPGTQTPQNLLRVSIGLEHVDDLIEDLAQALEE